MKQVGIPIAVLVIGVIVGQWMVSSPRPPQQPFGPTAVGWPTRNEIVTLSEYNQIRSGMGYWEVRAIVGEPGNEIARNHMDGVPGVMEPIETVMYSWANSDGSNMNAMFQNDRLMQKAQFGLR